jgi:hypothetical protein
VSRTKPAVVENEKLIVDSAAVQVWSPPVYVKPAPGVGVGFGLGVSLLSVLSFVHAVSIGVATANATIRAIFVRPRIIFEAIRKKFAFII